MPNIIEAVAIAALGLLMCTAFFMVVFFFIYLISEVKREH